MKEWVKLFSCCKITQDSTNPVIYIKLLNSEAKSSFSTFEKKNPKGYTVRNIRTYIREPNLT